MKYAIYVFLQNIIEGQDNVLKLSKRLVKRKLCYFYYDKTYYDNAGDDLSKL